MLFRANVMQVHMAVSHTSKLRSKTEKKKQSAMVQILILRGKTVNINLTH